VDIFFPGRHYITDLHYHGTHVASTVVSNGWVAAGVTSQVTLMGVKVCSVVGGCPGSAIFSGFYYAVDNGADVISMSLGGYFTKKDYPGYVSAINRLFNYAKRHGVTVAVSAGNAQLDLDHWKNGFKTYCDAPNVICVSATGPTSGGTVGPWPDPDTPAWYTNFGRSAVSVAAPGGNTGALVWAACSSSSLIFTPCQSSAYWSLGISGTSMAAPHVAGLAALLVEDYGRNPGRIRTLIQGTAEDLGQRGTDPYYGQGRINVADGVGLE
jgi:serine protease